MSDDEIKVALDHARHLAEMGVPIFIAKPARTPGGKWAQTGGHSGTGYFLPTAWQETEPDPDVLDGWEPGWAVCAVMGHVVDGLDVDSQKGGDASLAALASAGAVPRSYGRQRTPSGGTHDLIATLGVASRNGVRTGVDLKAGHDGNGHGFLFLAPTLKASKADGEIEAYYWETPPDLSPLLFDADETGARLRDILAAHSPEPSPAEAYDGPAYEDLPENLQEWAARETQRVIGWWRDHLATAEDWPEGETDDEGRGWEALAYQSAWALAKLAVAPWSALSEDDAESVYEDVLPDAIATNPQCRGKWREGLLADAADHPVDVPPWADFAAPGEAGSPDEARPAETVDVTNESDTLTWLEQRLGRGRLSGVFQRGPFLVHTPRVGEEGYLPPRDERDSNGPAQVRRIDSRELSRRIDHAYTVTKVTPRGKQVARLFPEHVASRAVAAPDLLPHVRQLHGVTHTPVIRPDGTVLAVPGYDDASGMLYLPDPGLVVPTVPDEPSREDVRRAGALVLRMLGDFPFVTPHDRANFIGALLTPLIRPLTPPPYKLLAIGAPQRGSGKSLLAWVMRELHGGVFKAEFPTSEDEVRKFVTSTLDATTGPVVQFDNVAGVLKSSVLDGLLTSATWTDRRLGGNEMIDRPNDRLWVVTGNNVHIGGDLERRTLWVTINAGVERPEERLDFAIPDLRGWVRENRGALLAALLTLARGWVTAGSVPAAQTTTDDYGPWRAVVQGILAHADLGETVGTFEHSESVQKAADPEEEEWAGFLAAVHREFGTEAWTVADLLGRVWDEDDDFAVRAYPDSGIPSGVLPGDVGERLLRSGRTQAARSLGKWLGFRNGRWAEGFSAQMIPGSSARHAKRWRVVAVEPEGSDLL